MDHLGIVLLYDRARVKADHRLHRGGSEGRLSSILSSPLSARSQSRRSVPNPPLFSSLRCQDSDYRQPVAFDDDHIPADDTTPADTSKADLDYFYSLLTADARKSSPEADSTSTEDSYQDALETLSTLSTNGSAQEIPPFIEEEDQQPDEDEASSTNNQQSAENLQNSDNNNEEPPQERATAIIPPAVPADETPGTSTSGIYHIYYLGQSHQLIG